MLVTCLKRLGWFFRKVNVTSCHIDRLAAPTCFRKVNVTSRHIDRLAAPTCCAVNVLKSRISFLFSWPWWMRCVVKHNMLKIPSIYRTQITHLQSGNQTDMELRNWTVGLRQQVQHIHHAEIPLQNSQSHSKCTPLCNKSYSTYRLQHLLRKWRHPSINITTNWKPIPTHH